MAMWRLRRLYHAEAAFCAYEMKSLAELNSPKQLGDHTLTGMAVNANQDTASTFRRQEAALERTFYRAFHELQRLHAKRPAKLALDPNPASEDTQEPEINSIPTPDHPPADPNPPTDPTASPQTGIHVVPPAENMK